MLKRLFTILALAALLTPLGGIAPVGAVSAGDTATIGAGNRHSMAIKTDGSLWAWGDNAQGQLGTGYVGNEYDSYLPVKIMDEITAVSAGQGFSAALKIDGSLWTWGANALGQLGQEQASPYPVRMLDEVTAVSAGANGALALKADSSLWSWGNGSHTPSKLLDGVTGISAGHNHGLAVKNDDSLWAWGANSRGQLGTGDVTSASVPVKIMDEVAAVSAGGAHSLALKNDGSLWAWGDNELGQVGNGYAGDQTNQYGDPIQTTPVHIMDNVTAISAGSDFSLALMNDGSLWAWGGNEWGQLGNDRQGDAQDIHGHPIQTTPAAVQSGITAISAGQYHAMALDNGGNLFTWGGNTDGELGNGSIGYSYVPNLVMREVMASEISGALAGRGIVSDPNARFSATMYPYPQVMAKLDEDKISAVTELTAKRLVGELTGIFQLSEELYCAVAAIDGRVTGSAVIKEIRHDGAPDYRTVQAVSGALSAEALADCIAEAATTPNLAVDYQQANGFTSGTEYVAYLEELLNNMDGVTPNDAAKSLLATYLESAIVSASRATVTADNNQVTVVGADIAAAINAAAATRSGLEALLEEHGVELNKVVDSVIMLSVRNINNAEPMQITLEQSVAEGMGDAAELILYLGDNRHTVFAGAASLHDNLARERGMVQITPTGAYKHDITFVNVDGETMERIPAPIGFTLPAQSALDTVFVTYKGGSDNWGGQYDETAGTLEFATNYSGTYEVISSDIQADDLDELPEEMHSPITFMLSKGYLELADGSFKPEDLLTRYDFTAALVKMFFALDRSLSCTFTDISEDSPYYDYIASAQAADIAQGYGDGAFRGEEDISVEEVVTLCARTLTDKKGYLYPDEPEEYLTFDDARSIGRWAEEDIALAVREGLIEGSGRLDPQSSIDRGASAVILYNLFMLLYETTPITYAAGEPAAPPAADEPEVLDPGAAGEIPDFDSVMPLVAGAIIVVGIAVLVMLRRKRS